MPSSTDIGHEVSGAPKNASRRLKIHISLALIFVFMCVWQVIEHSRVKAKARDSLLDRARDISTSLSVVIRSMSRFGIIQQDRLEGALGELVKSRELRNVALLNNAGNIVASAGEPVKISSGGFPKQKAVWSYDSVMITNIVDLGLGLHDMASTHTTPIVMKRPERTPRPPDFPTSRSLAQNPRRRPDMDDDRRRPPDMDENRRRPSSFRRPPWLTEEQFKELREKQGLHGFVLEIRTDAFRAETSRDFWLRIGILVVTLIAVLGMAAAWQSLEKSEELRIYLVKARELNRHLRELNVAAAGLAHETRNPLNLVRGQAQVISRDHSISPEVRKQSLSIVEEVDRVTNRLSEFINYSKPALPRPVPVKLSVVVQDVERTLSADIQDKSIHFRISGPDIVVEADEGLLRQVLFNLVLNAVQAVEEGGEIEVLMESSGSGLIRRSPEGEVGEASISVKDNGCGIAPEDRENVYRPYFTTHETGTGLGLAVVRRIVQAHGWEVEHKPAGAKGTVFILSKLKIIRTAEQI